MPNWCYNTATVSHEDKSKLDALEVELMKENPEPLNLLCPRPAAEEDWYSWNVNNWGTKWDISPMDWSRDSDNSISMQFDSAWAPPIALYEFLESEGWTVSALYHEPGMGFAGRFEDGYDQYFEMDWTDRESVENLPSDILDFTNALEDLDNYEQEQLEEKLADLERTEWFDVSVNPAVAGRYEVVSEAWDFPQYCEFDGKKWGRWEGDEIVVTKWRGLVEEYRDYDAEFEELKAELDNIEVK